jgi:hypothetical protein
MRLGPAHKLAGMEQGANDIKLRVDRDRNDPLI